MSLDNFKAQNLQGYWEVIQSRAGTTWVMQYDDVRAAIAHLEERQHSPSLSYSVREASDAMRELYAQLDLCVLCTKKIVVGDDVRFYYNDDEATAVHERCEVRE